MTAEPRPPIVSLPLFPLNNVLFPSFLLSLHVFEERYKAMIGACIERNEPFGVVLIREGTEVGNPAVPYDIGCTARILAVDRLDDGRMNLTVMGEKRFRLLEYSEAHLPYLIGRVETFDEDAREEGDLQLLTCEAVDLFVQYITLLAKRAGVPMPQVELPDDAMLLSYYIASAAQMPQEEKQQLLETADTAERLGKELVLLHEQLVNLRASLDQPYFENEAPGAIVDQVDPSSERWSNYRHLSRN